MDEVKDLKNLLFGYGVAIPEQIRTKKGLKKYLETQKAILKVATRSWEEKLKLGLIRLEAIEKALKRLGGEKE